MIVVTHPEVKFEVSNERCCGCKKCVRTCMEDVWQWDAEQKCCVPKYPDECVKCYQCELVCPNNCIEIVPVIVMQVDPLEV